MVATDETTLVNPVGRGWSGAESYWVPSRLVTSAWLEHAPFVSWLVGQLKPATFVELGTHNGFSFFTVCEAAARLGTSTRSFAIDSWLGDEHSGFYGDEVFAEVKDVADRLYPDDAVLLRGYFDEYASRFEAGTVDLLHIDGRHRYDDVKHDFETWLPAVAGDGIVLLHDIAVVKDDFGVKKFWNEISRQYPSFTFDHCNGLGVLSIGTVREPLRALFDADADEGQRIRDFYSEHGAAVTAQWMARENERLLHEQISDLSGQIAAVKSSSSWRITAPLRGAVDAARRLGGQRAR